MRPSSLRAQLLFWLLGPLALAGALDAWASYRAAHAAATLVQQRMLLGAARVIAEQVHLEEGVVQVMIPPAALELFASPSRDRVFYRVSGQDGQLLSGYFDMALPQRRPAAEEAVFFDSVQRERPIHVAAFAQPVLAAPSQGPVLIEVGQTLEGRDQLARDIWSATVGRHFALLALVAALLWFGLRRGLAPVLQLRDRMLRRGPGSLEPLRQDGVPSELRPLVAALNDYMARLDAHVSAQGRFIADASHQLRTPLALLNTQVTFALRNADPAPREEALRAIQASVRQGMRLVQQLLTFTMAQAAPGAGVLGGGADLAATARRVLEAMAPLAQERGIDLGFEAHGGPLLVAAPGPLLHELVANLVDNALRYTPPGGIVTASVAGTATQVLLRVQDNGPGIPAAERENVFRRFYRLHDGRSDGCGLGLAIVRQIAASCRGRVALDDALGSGLLVSVDLPRLAGPAAG